MQPYEIAELLLIAAGLLLLHHSYTVRLEDLRRKVKDELVGTQLFVVNQMMQLSMAASKERVAEKERLEKRLEAFKEELKEN